MFRVEITETGYAAFTESEGPEVARILRKLADKVEGELRADTEQGGQLYDLNGNTVGRWGWTRAGFCARHGGPWGEDETCEACTDENGDPR